MAMLLSVIPHHLPAGYLFMAVMNVPFNPDLGIAVAAAKVFAERKAQTLFEKALPVHGLGNEVGQSGAQS